MKLGDQFFIQTNYMDYMYNQNKKSETMKWTHPQLTLEDVFANTKKANKASVKPKAEDAKVSEALSKFPAEYRESVKVLMEEVTLLLLMILKY